jgi:hypothetical protein
VERPTPIPPTPPPGWNIFSRSEYQIALPASWQELVLQDQDLKDAIATAQSENPPLAAELNTLLQSGQYKAFIFYAADKSARPGVRTISIARTTLGGSNDLQTFAASYAEALPQVIRGAHLVEAQGSLEVNGMRAAAFVYDVPLINSNGVLTTSRGVQYLYQLDSGAAYLVTVTGDAREGDKFGALARAIATSFVGTGP